MRGGHLKHPPQPGCSLPENWTEQDEGTRLFAVPRSLEVTEGSLESPGLGVLGVGGLWGQVLLWMPTVYLEKSRAALDEERVCPRGGA